GVGLRPTPVVTRSISITQQDDYPWAAVGAVIPNSRLTTGWRIVMGYALSPLRTQGCGPWPTTQGSGPSALPLGYVRVHRCAVLGSARAPRRPPLRGRPVGARIVSTLCTVGGRKTHCRRVSVLRHLAPRGADLRPTTQGCGPSAYHPGVRTFGPSPGLRWDPPLRGSRFGEGTAE